MVNLSKFVSEAVTAILDAKLKSSDINAAVQVPIPVFFRFKFDGYYLHLRTDQAQVNARVLPCFNLM